MFMKAQDKSLSIRFYTCKLEFLRFCVVSVRKPRIISHGPKRGFTHCRNDVWCLLRAFRPSCKSFAFVLE